MSYAVEGLQRICANVSAMRDTLVLPNCRHSQFGPGMHTDETSLPLTGEPVQPCNEQIIHRFRHFVDYLWITVDM
ncbi:MAG: hypothetical protein C7B43_17755 [Sulfobacillus benefaciens]|uniref:Uncharacterized protein n=1 Tax=Sulfobacillus benefaciens TaxID=453960 RepID=A0A2T2WS08_9FIRM|nr:MAG: hypothetical protein C7B43_17755 [Sulfobacillus benefaciens]HBQ96815.1 hypothetical protein [Sulfobacillus sp.]